MSLFQYQARAEPVPLDDFGEQITLDKWWQPLSLPMRAAPAVALGLAISIVEPTLAVPQQLDWLVQQSVPVLPSSRAPEDTSTQPLGDTYDPATGEWRQPTSLPMRLEAVTPGQWGGVAAEPFVVEPTLFVLQQLDWLVEKPLPVVPPIVAIDTTIWVPDLIPSSYDPNVLDWGQATSLPMRLEPVTPAQWGGAGYDASPPISPTLLAKFILQRRALNPPAAWADIGSAATALTTILSDPAVTFSASTGYQFRILRQNSFGKRTPYPSKPTRMDLDGGKALVSPAPPARPKFLTATPIAGGKVRLTWYYDEWGQGSFPDKFILYEGADADNIDYGTALTDSVTSLAYTAAVAGKHVYQFTTGTLAESGHVFGVRAEISGNSDGNSLTTTLATKAFVTAPTGPGQPELIDAETVT